MPRLTKTVESKLSGAARIFRDAKESAAYQPHANVSPFRVVLPSGDEFFVWDRGIKEALMRLAVQLGWRFSPIRDVKPEIAERLGQLPSEEQRRFLEDCLKELKRKGK
jgi:hypothetical protein